MPADISMTFSDDQLTVSVPQAQLTNGLNAAPQSSKDKSSSEQSDWTAPTVTVAPIPKSTSAVSSLATVTSCTSSGGSTRFTVQPTRADQSVIYHQPPVRGQASMSATDGANTGINDSSASSFLADEQMESDSAQRKKVSFPDGESLIKGFAHAPNPWYNGMSLACV